MIIRVTRKELYEQAESWWWTKWLLAWGNIGAMVLEVYNMERRLWH